MINYNNHTPKKSWPKEWPFLEEINIKSSDFGENTNPDLIKDKNETTIYGWIKNLTSSEKIEKIIINKFFDTTKFLYKNHLSKVTLNTKSSYKDIDRFLKQPTIKLHLLEVISSKKELTNIWNETGKKLGYTEFVYYDEIEDLMHRWVDSLKSEKYLQGRGSLRNEFDEFCCLGVLCDIWNPQNWDKDEELDLITYQGQEGSLPSKLEDTIEEKYPNFDAGNLINFNDDDKWSFMQIAKYIEDVILTNKDIDIDDYKNEENDDYDLFTFDK